MNTVDVTADLDLLIERDGASTIHAHLSGRSNRLVLEVDDPGAFAGAADAGAIRTLAGALAARDVSVVVVHDERRLVTFGAVSAPWWQRRATGSRHIRMGTVRGVWTLARARMRSTPALLPAADLAPPPTMFPLVPTLRRRGRGPLAGTHDPAHGGAPRLTLARTALWADEVVPVFWLDEETTIGSDESCDIVLAGLAPCHAVVLHDHDDEYVISPVDGLVRVNGARVDSQLLRTGSRIDIGEHTLAFRRDEYADHGRPFGGRVGGELGHQVPQPPRR